MSNYPDISSYKVIYVLCSFAHGISRNLVAHCLFIVNELAQYLKINLYVALHDIIHAHIYMFDDPIVKAKIKLHF